MQILQVDVDTLRTIVKESVAEAIRVDRFKFFESMLPAVSQAEMKDIVDNYGTAPQESEFIDISAWFEDEN